MQEHSLGQAFGNAGVGIMRGPGLANFDFSIAKNIKMQDGKTEMVMLEKTTKLTKDEGFSELDDWYWLERTSLT